MQKMYEDYQVPCLMYKHTDEAPANTLSGNALHTEFARFVSYNA